MAHHSTEVAFRCTNEEVIVVIHETIGMNFRLKHLMDFAQQFQKHSTMIIMRENRLSPCPSIHDVVVSAGIFDAKWT
jgi:hypothetical protein